MGVDATSNNDRNNGMAIKIGDKRWYVYGYESPLTVKVNIDFIDEYGFLWFDDEPLGHEVAEDELYDNLDDALAEMEDRKSERENGEIGEEFTLEDFRKRMAEFILSTREGDDRTVKEFLKDYPEKIKGVDWFV